MSSIKIISSIEEIDLPSVDVVTNCGLLRPINRRLINELSRGCVIPYMREPWEYRIEDVDMDACREKGIKVYGTNEEDHRLRTFEYIGFIALYLLLDRKITPFSANILVLGNEKFTNPITEILTANGYSIDVVNEYKRKAGVDSYNVIIIAERARNIELVGNTAESFIKADEIDERTMVIHISGKVDFDNLSSEFLPGKPAKFGYMSFNTDYIDPQAVIDLHTAGLKVAEGMLKANGLDMENTDYRTYMQENYPALAFDDPKYW